MTNSDRNITPEDIGTHIRKLREKHGYSLSDISRTTKISINVLESLEKGDWKGLGTRFLVKSFVKSYCTALGEPYEELVNLIDASDDKYFNLSRFKTLPLEKHRTIVKDKSKYLFYFMVMFISICMTAGGIYVYRHNAIKSEPQMPAIEETEVKIPEKIVEINKDTKPYTTSSISEQSNVPPVSLVDRQHTTENAPVAIDENKKKEETISEQVKEKPSSIHRLIIEAIEETWVKVWVDKSKPVSRLMKPGDTMNFKVKESARMIIGNAGGIRISWDDRSFSNIGKKGAVLRLSIPEGLFEKSRNE